MATRQTFLLLAVAVNINILVNSSNIHNVNEGDCRWLQNDVDKSFKLNCPDLDENVLIITKKKFFVIVCEEPVKFDVAMIPKFDLYEVRDVKLSNCIVDENINFGSILEHFGINNTNTIQVKNMKSSLQPLTFSNGFESLENLVLQDSLIRKLDKNVFQALKKLEHLNLGENEITDLPRNIFANLTNLKSLWLPGNKIQVLEEGLFTHQKDLWYLQLEHNEITEIPRTLFANLTKLEDLLLSDNKIKFLEEGLFEHQKKLQTLNLNTNEISDLPQNIFANLTNLERLFLTRNHIKFLDEKLFTHQKKLSDLTLAYNEISTLPRNLFANLENLESLFLTGNKIKFLDEGLFKHQKKLSYLTFENNEISNLPRNLFKNLTSLRFFHLSRNKIGSNSSDEMTITYAVAGLILQGVQISNGIVFPTNFELFEIEECEFEYAVGKNVSNNTALLSAEKRVNTPHPNIFASQKKLEDISLTNCELTELNDGLFNGLNELIQLDLSYNNLTSISGHIFRELHNLESISLDHNYIKSIDSDAFVSQNKLTTLYLSYNQLQYFDNNKSTFIYLDNLSTLNLSNNYMTTLPSGWKDVKRLHLLDLGFNNISSYKYGDVHVSKNKIYYKEYDQLSEEELNDLIYVHDEFLHIFLNNNSLKCDCTMYRFLLVRKKGLINEFLNQLSKICEERRPWCNETRKTGVINEFGNHLSEFCGGKRPQCNQTTEITSKDCLLECTCMTNLENNTEIRCTKLHWFSELISLALDHLISNKSIEFYINNSRLDKLPNLKDDKRVITIQASYNDISDIKLENISPNLRFLDISHNKINTISADAIDALRNHKKLEIFLIGNNPWQCDCSTNSEKFIELFTETTSMTDFQETKCRLPSGVYTEFSSLKELCTKERQMKILIILAILSAIIGILGILLGILFYKYKKVFQIWLYAHNICLCCIGEDEFDKDKKFDAFISYSYHDEDLAICILNELETGSPAFKICIHERDFVPGRLIQNSIAESMDNSCRTIIILSKNFLRSVWGQLEFRRAYDTGLVERRMRLIVVINGDIGDKEQLEPTLKSYLKTHTYIKWGDPWFWQKMRYALPHRNRNDSNTSTNNIEMREMC